MTNKELFQKAMRFLSEGEIQVSQDGKTLPASSFPRHLRRKWAKDLAKNEQLRLKEGLLLDDNQR